MASTYDGADNYLLTFGGGNPNVPGGNYSWAYSSDEWTNVTPIHSPPPLLGAQMAYDEKDHYVVMFGGFHHVNVAYTWTFVGGTWTNITTPTHPPANFSGSMAYDVKGRSVIWYGGNYTWKFSRGAWRNITTSGPHPPDLGGSMMAWDPNAGSLVLFGGAPGLYSYQSLNDTWEFSGGHWTNVTGTVAPSGRELGQMTFDPKLGGLILFGGYGTTVFKDTWLFSNGTWTNLNLVNHPLGRGQGAMAYDSKNHYLVLFGGATTVAYYSNDTWKLT